MARYGYLLGAAALVLVTGGLATAQTPAANTAAQPATPPPVAAAAAPAAAQPTTWVDGDSGYRDVVFRFGWWATTPHGSMNGVGEYQDWKGSPFFDVDYLGSTGTRTVQVTTWGTDQESTNAKLYYYGPQMSADVDYERFIHRFNRDSLDNFGWSDAAQTYSGQPNGSPTPVQPSGIPVVGRTINDLGSDYAIRVQEYSAKFKGDITDGIRWKLGLWGMNKEGDRQAIAVGHCYSVTNPPATTARSRCHEVSNSQHINWTTNQIEPGIEANFGALTVEYTRTMRSFSSADEVVTRNYNTANHTGWIVPGPQVPYDVTVPNYTGIDRLKTSLELNEFNHLYSYMYIGDTQNLDRDTHQFVNGIDARWTNDAIDGLRITGYWKRDNQSGTLPTTFPENGIVQGGDTIANYDNPIAFQRTETGVKTRWVPVDSGWPGLPGVAFISGYQYSLIDRSYVDFSPGFSQPDTVTHQLEAGISKKWSREFDSYVGYKYRNNTYPLFGVNPETGNDDLDTLLPMHENLVELRATWTPSDNFLLSGTVGIERRTMNHLYVVSNPDYYLTTQTTVPPGVGFVPGSPIPGRPLPDPKRVDFQEDNFPIVVSAWWAPTCKLSLNAGYAWYSNFIGQTINMGDEYNNGTYNTGARDYFEVDSFQSRWGYNGTANVVDLGSNYAATEKLKLNGSVQWVRGENRFVPVAPAVAYMANGAAITPNWTPLAGYSAVTIQTIRLTAGVDYLVRENVGTFFRYVYNDYEDITNPGNTGNASGFLAGINARY